MTALRRIVLDDTDPAIQYGPSGWFVADATKLNPLGNYGPIYNNTSHGTTTDSTLSLSFNGTSISVMGTIAITPPNANNVTDPIWDCFVDEIKIQNPNPTFGFPENNWILCDQAQIAPGSHVLTIQVQSKGQAFYLDQILYTPLPTANYDVAVLEYTNTDPAVSFGTGWQAWGVQNVTQTTGAQVALNFHGTAVTLFGYIPTELPHNSSSGTYTIDGGPPVPFNLPGLAAQSATEYNAVMLTTNTLIPATHNLVVTYAGDSSKTPLAVGSFYVTSTSTSSPSNPSNNSPSSSPSNNTVKTTKHSSTGAIAGGIIGCLILLAVIVGLVFWCRRRRRREEEDTRRMSANPYMSSTMVTDTTPASLAGAQYSYASVPATYGYSHSNPETPGYPEPHHQPMTTMYPYTPPLSSPPPSDAGAGPSNRSHVHSPSASSANFSTSMHDVPASHAAPAAAVVGSYPTPVPSEGSVHSRGNRSKHEQELIASAALPVIPGDADLPLTPLRLNHSRPVAVLRHEDSGMRLNAMPPSPISEPEVVELPPGYSRD